MQVSLDEVRNAARRIAGAVERTPCLHSRTLSRLTGAEVILEGDTLADAILAARRARGVNALPES